MRIRWTAGFKIPAPLLSELRRGHREGKQSGMEAGASQEVIAGLENPPCMDRRRDAANECEAAASSCRESPLSCSKRAYRKPTQVDERGS